MILPLLLQAATPTPTPPPTPVPEADVVVVARRLANWRGTISTNPLWTRCKTTKSTGDRDIDLVGCTAMERCWPDILPRMRAAQAKGVVAADRARLESEAAAAFSACVKPQRLALIETLLTRRAAAREAGK